MPQAAQSPDKWSVHREPYEGKKTSKIKSDSIGFLEARGKRSCVRVGHTGYITQVVWSYGLA